jgi:predicted nucleic acid-binding protein
LKLSNVERHNLSQSDVTRFVENNNLKDLHSGERECLYLCNQIDVSILLTDDLAVREAAKRLKLIPVGSLGIVAKAYHLGRIPQVEAERHIINLYDVSSLFVTRSIVEMAIEQINLVFGAVHHGAHSPSAGSFTIQYKVRAGRAKDSLMDQVLHVLQECFTATRV